MHTKVINSIPSQGYPFPECRWRGVRMSFSNWDHLATEVPTIGPGTLGTWLPPCCGQPQDPGLSLVFLLDAEVTEKLPKITISFDYFKMKKKVRKSHTLQKHVINTWRRVGRMLWLLMPTQIFRLFPSFSPPSVLSSS